MTASTAATHSPARAGINIRPFYRLDLNGVPATALAGIYEFEGTCAIGEPTKYTIQFTHPRRDLSTANS
ncbi:hypothetical protein [Burkholderia ambifaria]|uniref:hypothetical protein n=1 Tax=Burkholderia ambifaria TaxID=152480 RepID=UPI0012FD67AF|nr:hypothetical protein [Burkholderia ambifaria]